MTEPVTVQSYNQKIAERSCRLQIPHVPNVQQIKTSVRGYNLLPGRPQLLAAIGKLLKLYDFWAHSFSLILRLRVNRSWPLTDLRNGLPRMDEKKNKTQRGKITGPSRLQNPQGSPWCISPKTHYRLMSMIAWPRRVCVGSHFCSPSHVMHALSSPVGTLIGDPSLKRRCPRIDKSIFE
jgi:hypothetical protein